MNKRLECVDAGSDYCPCYLAETNNCITCSQLQGKEFCECNWRGVCIYQEFVMNGSKIKPHRDYNKCQIKEINMIAEDCYLLKIKVNRTLARQLKEPGAFIFLRDSVLPQYFDVPMSIMQSDDVNGIISIAIQTIGAKTNSLINCKHDILIKGPYWNGAFGLKHLKKVEGKNCLVIVRGISQAPSLLVIEKLKKNSNKITLIIDKGSVGKIFINDTINHMGLDIVEEDVMSENGKYLIEQVLKSKDISLVFSAGSDLLHMRVINIIDELKLNPYIVVTNNNEICCGEGICGGCTTRLKDGIKVKPCKTQVDSRKMIERRVLVD